MKNKKALLLMALIVCIMFCLTNGLMIQKAFAQKADDPGFGSKKPAKDASGKEIKKEDKTPKPYQIAIGVGSFIVMILVIKFV